MLDRSHHARRLQPVLCAAATALTLAVSLVGLVGLGAPASASNGDDTVAGAQVVRPGRSVVLHRSRTAFADGTVSAAFRLPTDDRRGLRLVLNGRQVGDSFYRSTVRFGRKGPVLVTERVRDGRVTRLARAPITQRLGRTVRIDMRMVGGRIRSRGYSPTLLPPAWRVNVIDARPLAEPGTTQARAALKASAPKPVTLDYTVRTLIESLLGILDPAPSARCPRIGVYNYWDAEQDTADTVRQFGAIPEVTTSYYLATQDIVMDWETARIQRGTSPNIAIGTSGSQYLAALGTGPSHPNYSTALAWLKGHIANLATLADVDPDVPVYATIDHEFATKIATGMITGPSADPVLYGKALNLFYRLANEANPRIRTSYWIVGYNRDLEGRVASQFNQLPDTVQFDPYANTASDTVTSISTADLNWIRSQNWYVGQEIGLGEFGMPVALGDAALERFFTGVRGQLDKLGISFATFFNRERDFDTRIAERTDGKSFPRGQAAFGDSLTSSRSC